MSSLRDLDKFTRGYIEAAFFSTNDEADETGGEPLDKNYDVGDLADVTLARMKADCARFQALYGDLIAYDNRKGGYDSIRGDDSLDAAAGRDFWFTRNGHGAGFWDGDWAEPAATRLDEASKSFGEYDLYIGDDGEIYGSGGVVDPEPVAAASPRP